MRPEEWRKLKQIKSLCDRLEEVIGENVELFIAERPFLATNNSGCKDLTRLKIINEIHLVETKALLVKKLEKYLGEDRPLTNYEIEKIFGGKIVR